MLAVNPISSVRFGDGPANILEREGAFSKPKTEANASNNAASPASVNNDAGKAEKKSSTGKKVAGTIIGLAALAAVLVALPKVFPKAIKELSKEELKAKPGFMKTVGHYVAVTGNFIGKYTYEPIAKLFKRKKAPKAPDANGTNASYFA